MSDREMEEIRRKFAERVANAATLESDALRAAFAAVRREDFVGPGPWQIMRSADISEGYEQTPDANPVHLYDLVTVALDPERLLNNGEPASLARWLDQLAIRSGTRFLHVGSGVGYYTAIVAQAVSRAGYVLALEVDPTLAQRAARNLADWSNIEVRCAPGPESSDGPFDAIFVNAGATDLDMSWLDRLSERGRLLVPLTVSLPEKELGFGQMLLVERSGSHWPARFVGPVGIFHCKGARSERGEQLLRASFGSRKEGLVASLRRDPHSLDPECWLHAASFCLSKRSPSPNGQTHH